jgi:thiamine-phosphate pyrophosphorylase|tara:strand:+ start:328 stop:981 length:654 start_codon:yes stop_codon:yes gene_type:complete
MIHKQLTELLRLIVITDSELSKPMGLMNVISETLKGGASMIQLRDKHANANELLKVALQILPLTRAAGALLIINDRLDVAIASQADGVHLGPDDPPVADVRRVVSKNFIIGYSTDDPMLGKSAESQGANYLGCGTVYHTSTKSDAGKPIGAHGIKTMVNATNIPVVAIGGIRPENTPELLEAGASGVAVIGSIMSSPRPGLTTEQFLKHFPGPQANN